MSATAPRARTTTADMGMLDFDDHYKPPFTPKNAERTKGADNFEALQQLGHEKVSEDFEDSPHADRKPLEDETYG